MIKVFAKLQDFNKWRASITGSVGLVPTMGNLHRGHLTLAKKSLNENKYTIVTIFVNPKQFAPGEDFNSYPRTLNGDIKGLSSLLNGDHDEQLVVLAPHDEKEIYPDGHILLTKVNHPMTKVLCGAYREGHFDGVTTVVHRLFEITKPDIAYFGEKDYQQLTIIKEMVKEQKLPIKISSLAIVRDENGLALSSRNQYLSLEEKVNALNLSHSLISLSDELQKTSLDKVIILKNKILKSDSHWQYLEILDSSDLSIPNNKTKQVILAGAYILGKTRLIDNVITNILP